MINSWPPYALLGIFVDRSRHQLSSPPPDRADKSALPSWCRNSIDADASGIVFTADPVTGDDTMIEINAAWGLGEAIVGGQVSPDTITVERSSGRIMRTMINTKTIMTQTVPSGTAVVSVPTSDKPRPR